MTPEYNAPCGECRTLNASLETAADMHAADQRTIADLTQSLNDARADALVAHQATSALRELWQAQHGEPLVYIAGSFRGKGAHTDVYDNIAQAEAAWRTLADYGVYAVIPHVVSLRVDPACQRGEAWWRAYTKRLMKPCTRVLRLQNESDGADEEHELADELGIPVDHFITDTLKALGAWPND